LTAVDIHTHFLPRFFVEEAASGGVLGVREEDGFVVHPQGFRYPAADEFLSVDAKLRQMDELRIDLSVLSSAPTLFFYDRPPDEAVPFTRRCNDALAEHVAGQDRLLAIAGLPLQDPQAAADELERAVHELGMIGAQIGTNCEATPLDSPGLEPVLAKAEELDVPLVLHPYYVGPKPGLEDFYLVNSIGNPLDTTIAAMRLIHAGTLDRHPRLRLALVHAGGFVPFQLGRFDHAFDVRKEPRAHLSRRPSTYLGRFWLDTITHGDLALRFLRDLIGEERLVLGTDLPFDMADPGPVARLERAGISPDSAAAAAAELFGVADWSFRLAGATDSSTAGATDSSTTTHART
jgi:aminocarboxymuconate-semialdehyde decarboxylase